MKPDKQIISRISLLRKPLVSMLTGYENDDLETADRVAGRIIIRLIFLSTIESRLHFPDFRIKDKIEQQDSILLSFLLSDQPDEKSVFALFKNREHEQQKTNLQNVNRFFRQLKKLCEKLSSGEIAEALRCADANTLGRIYEMFLSKRAATNENGNVVFNKNVSTRKNAGVFYTPEYIVDYILQNSIEKKLGNLVPNQVAELRLLDPACGSGSFLLGAIDVLFKWHLQYYLDNKNLKESLLIKNSSGNWSLRPEESARIILNNIYGVDLDSEAVNICKLSIMLMIFREDNYSAGSSWQQGFISLDANIKCGNSLVEINRGEQMNFLFDNTDGFGNTFNWDSEFLNIFSDPNPGFDFIVGNPPYRRELEFKNEMDEIARSSLGKKYRSARMDYWYYFVHRGIELLKKGGELSFITSSYWIANKGAKKLIEHIQSECAIAEIFLLNKCKVFNGVSGQHMIFRIVKTDENLRAVIKSVSASTRENAKDFVSGLKKIDKFCKEQTSLFVESGVSVTDDSGNVLGKLAKFRPLEKFGTVRQGIAENPANINKRNNHKYGNKWKTGQGVFALTDEELKTLDFQGREAKLIRPYYDLSDIDRYYLAKKPSLNLIFSTRQTCPDINEFPALKKHLIRFKEIMDNRRETKNGSNKWWHLHWPREEKIWQSYKIVALQMAKRPSFVASKGMCYTSFSTNVFVPNDDCKMNYYYLTGLLNSKVLWLWFNNYAKKRGVGLEISGAVFGKVPIREIDYNNNEDIATHNRLVKLVGRIMDLKQKARCAQTDSEKFPFLKEIRELDEDIDKLVVKLYGMSEKDWEEILEVLDLPV